MNQRPNNNLVIEWVKAILCKSKNTFMNFDIVDFDQSISEELLSKTIQYA